MDDFYAASTTNMAALPGSNFAPPFSRLAVMLYVRFPLSLRNVEDLLHEGGIDVSHETVRFWWNKFGSPKIIVTDKLRPYNAAMNVIGNTDQQETGRGQNNRAENSHLPFRRRARAVLRSRRMRSLQKCRDWFAFV